MKKLPNPKEARKLAKLTQVEVAELAGISLITVKRREDKNKWAGSRAVMEAHQRACGLKP